MQWTKVNKVSQPSRQFTYGPGDQLELKGFIAKMLKKQLEMDIFFRNVEITNVEAETPASILASVKFLSKIAESCHCCGKQLDDPISRATGIGPVCIKKIGLPRATLENAHLILEAFEKLIQEVGEVGPVWIPKSQIKQRLNDVTASHNTTSTFSA